MSNTKRDKYDEDIEVIKKALCRALAYPREEQYVLDAQEALGRISSDFPPPAEDARQCAVNITGLDPDAYEQGCPAYLKAANALSSAAAAIESFAQSRVEPWREALNWVTHLLCGQGKRGGAPESGEIEEAAAQAHALLSDSPAKEAAP